MVRPFPRRPAGRLARLEVVGLERVSVWRSTPHGRRALLHEVDWQVRAGEHWSVLGPNGAGKTTLVRVISAEMRPSDGVARVLGGRLGRVPLADLRRRIGVVEPQLARRFYPDQSVLQVVLTGFAGTVLLVEDVDRGRLEHARGLLEFVGAAALAGRRFATCSEGERARILLARALVVEAPLLVLDEPTAGLDVGGRLMLEDALARAAASRPELTTVTVTHDLGALSPQTTHVLFLREGAVVAAGPVADAVTPANVADCFRVPREVAARVLHVRG
jgi:iron complex transport system ATP-binding protein